MGLLNGRPVCSMSGGEALSELDLVDDAMVRLAMRRLQLVSRVDETGHAEEIGAHDTARLLTFRYRLDSIEAHRDVRLARALPKYPAVSAALPDTTTSFPGADPSDTTTDGATTDGATIDDGGADDGGADGGPGGAGEWPLRPAQAQAIVRALDRVATRVPADHLAAAEQQLVILARHLPLAELRKAAKEIADLLDSDGPGPGEDKAYGRESLTLADAENGVKFRGFLANENAELLRGLVHAGARPRKTIDGELDPRPRDKRQADALTTALTIAATATDIGFATANLRPTIPTPNTGTVRLPDAGTAPAPSSGTPRTADAGTARATNADMLAAAADDANAETGHKSDAPDLTAAGADTSAGSGIRDSAAAALFPAPAPMGDRHRASAAATSGSRPGTRASVTRLPPTTGRQAPAPAAGTAPAGETAGSAGDGGTPGAGDGWVPGFGAKANITVTIDFNDLKAATADATGQLVYGDALSAAAIRRLACDAAIIPLVLGSNSEPLDVGRSERLVNRAMRRALNARDKGCVVCGAPPIQCDAHHVQSWIDGGPTAISNLVLLCRRHHIDLHHGHWTITITNGTVHVSRPTWADPPPVTRPAGQGHPPAHTRVDASLPNGALTRAEAAGPTPCDPWDESAPTSGRAFRPAGDGDGRSCADGTDGVSAVENARLDPWGESEIPEQAPRRNRWANESTLEEAARFAVWGDTARNGEPIAASPPPGR